MSRREGVLLPAGTTDSGRMVLGSCSDGDRVTVGMARIAVFIPASHSLKDKRMVLRRVKSLVRDKFNAAIAEVGDNELWQRAALGISVVGKDRPFTESALDEIIRFVQAHAEVTNVEREVQSFNDTFGPGAGPEHWRG